MDRQADTAMWRQRRHGYRAATNTATNTVADKDMRDAQMTDHNPVIFSGSSSGALLCPVLRVA